MLQVLTKKTSAPQAAAAKKPKNLFNWIVGGLIAAIIITWFVLWYIHWSELKAYDTLIATESLKYQNPTGAADMIRTAIEEILDNPTESKLAKAYSADFNVSVQTAVLDTAVAKLIALKYLTPNQ